MLFGTGCAVRADAGTDLKDHYSEDTFIECGLPEKFSLGPYDAPEASAHGESLWFKGLPGEEYEIRIDYENVLPIVSLTGPEGGPDVFFTQNRHDHVNEGRPFQDTLRVALPAEGVYQVHTTESSVDSSEPSQISNFIVELACDPPASLGELGCGASSMALLDDFHPEQRYEVEGAKDDFLAIELSFSLEMSAPKVVLLSATTEEAVSAIVNVDSSEHWGHLSLEASLPADGRYHLVVAPGESYGGFEIRRPCASIAIIDVPGP